MPRHALSKTKKAQIKSEHHAKCMSRAIECYHAEAEKAPGEKCLGLRTICKQVQNEYLKEKNVAVQLSPTTLWRLAKEYSRPKRDVNQERGWLSKEETDVVVDYLVETSAMGFGLSQLRLKEHVDEICRACLGDEFPVDGVGKNWTHRFVERNSERIHVYKAKPLHDIRGKAVNPETDKEWGDMREEHQMRGDNGKPIAAECTLALDEAGFQPNGDEGHEKVIGGKGKKIQYQQQAGSRENITAIVAITGDGKALSPAVIFAGKGYLAKWKQANPANASIGYSKKGWTDSEIGAEYAKHIDLQTRKAAKGRTRLLYVDGHNSHYTRAFLVYCRDHNIKVLCYPAHTTHVYQGLDVAVFSAMKLEYGRQRDAHFRETGEAITKENFLKIFGEVYLKVLTPDLIRTAFRKTGVVSFSRNVVPPEMMAPSRDTSFRYYTPIEPPPEVKIVTDMMVDVLQPGLQPLATKDRGNTPTNTGNNFPVRVAVRDLQSTELRYLVSDSPIKASSNPPDVETMVLSPMKPIRGLANGQSQQATQKHIACFDRSLLTAKTKTPLEKALQQALIAVESQYGRHKAHVARLQSGFVLQRVYCRRVRNQLHAREKKTEGQGKGKGRLNGDGRPRLLTSQEFIEVVEEHEEAVELAKQKKKTLDESKAQHELAVKEWELQDQIRRGRNVELLCKFEKEKDEWEEARKVVKAAKTMTLKAWENQNPKPKKTDYLLPAIPKPTKKKQVALEEAEEDKGEEVGDLDEGEWTDEDDDDNQD